MQAEATSPAGFAAVTGSAAMKQRIAELEEEVRRLKRTARCPHEVKPGIGGVVQTLRQKKELSINQLADASGVSKGQISRLEREDDPNAEIHTLRRLAAALGVKCSELLAMSESPQRTTS